MAASWKQLQTGIASLNLGQSANKLARGFNSSVQATKERLGQIAAEEITELPQGMSLSSWSACMAKLNLSLQSTRTWKPASMHCGRRTLVCSSELLSSRVRYDAMDGLSTREQRVSVAVSLVGLVRSPGAVLSLSALFQCVNKRDAYVAYNTERPMDVPWNVPVVVGYYSQTILPAPNATNAYPSFLGSRKYTKPKPTTTHPLSKSPSPNSAPLSARASPTSPRQT